MKARRGLLLLLVLAVLFAVTRLLPKGGGVGASARPARSADILDDEGQPGPRGRSKAAPAWDPPVLDLARLEPPAEGASSTIGRNLFRYGAPKAPAVPAKPPLSGPGGGGKVWRPGEGAAPPAQPLTPPAPAVPAPPPKPQPPPVTVRYLGAFGPAGRLVAVFADDSEIYDVFEGETFAGKYILRRINWETVELGFAGFPDDITEKLEVGP